METIIAAPTSTKNQRAAGRGNASGEEGEQVFWVKLHIGADAPRGWCTALPTMHDVTQAHRLLHGEEARGVGWRGTWGYRSAENLGLAWQVALKPGQRKLAPGKWRRRRRRSGKVEHPFLDVAAVAQYAICSKCLQSPSAGLPQTSAATDVI